jgi:tyrosine-specific transport protein
MKQQLSRLIGGVLLVAGTTIGAAMLAIPISTSGTGFYPSLLLFVSIWLMMTFTSLLFLEATLWEKGEVNIISMAKKNLGLPGEIFSWVCYLFLLYSLTTAYIAGSGPIFTDVFHLLSGGYEVPEWVGAFPLLIIFGFFVYRGTSAVDKANRYLMLGLLLAYSALAVVVSPSVKLENLERSDFSVALFSVPVIVTSFGFHIIIPSLKTYMQNDVKQIQKAILLGSAIPVFVYIFWEFLVLGTVPLIGDDGLVSAQLKDHNGAKALEVWLNQESISIISRFFSFFSIVTSFLGVSLSLRDFLADGLKIKKSRQGRLILYFLTFAPPLLITISYPRIFMSALHHAGVFGVVTLLCLLPVAMVWSGRYHKRFVSKYRAPGGKLALVLVALASFGVIALEIYQKLQGQH